MPSASRRIGERSVNLVDEKMKLMKKKKKKRLNYWIDQDDFTFYFSSAFNTLREWHF